MKLLFLTPYPPWPPHGGGQQRMFQMLRLLSARHEIHLLTLAAAGTDLAPLEAFCRVTAVPSPAHTPPRRLRTLLLSTMPDMVLRGQGAGFVEALDSLLRHHDFDVVQAESIEMAQYGRGGAGTNRGTRRPLWCYDAFNAEYLLQRRAAIAAAHEPTRLPVALYSLIQWHKLRRYERRLGKRFDLGLAVSAVDRAALTREAPDLRMEVVPNGVDTDYFQPSPSPRPEPPGEAPYLLFTGTLDFRPNVDAAQWFVQAIWPGIQARHPELEFRIVGQRPGSAIHKLATVPGVKLVGPVPDVRPWFAHARAYVLPMRVGGGARLKLLETWAMGLPCVTTTLGAEGVDGFQAGTHALVADQPATFGAAVDRLLGDLALGRELAVAARRLVVERYDWPAIVGKLEDLYTTALARRTVSDDDQR